MERDARAQLRRGRPVCREYFKRAHVVKTARIYSAQLIRCPTSRLSTSPALALLNNSVIIVKTTMSSLKEIIMPTYLDPEDQPVLPNKDTTISPRTDLLIFRPEGSEPGYMMNNLASKLRSQEENLQLNHKECLATHAPQAVVLLLMMNRLWVMFHNLTARKWKEEIMDLLPLAKLHQVQVYKNGTDQIQSYRNSKWTKIELKQALMGLNKDSDHLREEPGSFLNNIDFVLEELGPQRQVSEANCQTLICKMNPNLRPLESKRQAQSPEKQADIARSMRLMTAEAKKALFLTPKRARTNSTWATTSVQPTTSGASSTNTDNTDHQPNVEKEARPTSPSPSIVSVESESMDTSSSAREGLLALRGH
jgi:hypothetical protein